MTGQFWIKCCNEFSQITLPWMNSQKKSQWTNVNFRTQDNKCSWSNWFTYHKLYNSVFRYVFSFYHLHFSSSLRRQKKRCDFLCHDLHWQLSRLIEEISRSIDGFCMTCLLFLADKWHNMLLSLAGICQKFGLIEALRVFFSIRYFIKFLTEID